MGSLSMKLKMTKLKYSVRSQGSARFSSGVDRNRRGMSKA